MAVLADPNKSATSELDWLNQQLFSRDSYLNRNTRSLMQSINPYSGNVPQRTIAVPGYSPPPPEADTTPTRVQATPTPPPTRPTPQPTNKPSAPVAKPGATAGASQKPGGILSFYDKAGELLPDRYGDAAQQLKQMAEQTKKDRQSAKGLALMQAGLGIMASKSPYLGQAIGEGGKEGVAAYRKEKQALGEQDLRRAAMNLQMSGLMSRHDARKMEGALKLYALNKAATAKKKGAQPITYDKIKIGDRLKIAQFMAKPETRILIDNMTTELKKKYPKANPQQLGVAAQRMFMRQNLGI